MGKNKSIVVWSKQGCSYCDEVKQYLESRELDYQIMDVTENEDRREVLEVKYGVRHVPVVEIGQGNVYEAVTKVGISHLEKLLAKYA